MNRHAMPAALVLLALAGCNANQTASPGPAASMTATGPLRPPGGPYLAAEDICVKAVQQQTNALGVAVISSQTAAPTTLVMIGYPESRSPWRCVVAADGRVTEVTPTGS